MYVQVPQWADDWAVCAVDIPDAKCHWYVMAPDNTFGEGFDWETAPWFDANGLNDVAPMQEVSVLENYKRDEPISVERSITNVFIILFRYSYSNRCCLFMMSAMIDT